MSKPKEVVERPKPQRTGVIQFFRETVHELKRVRWPKRPEVVTYTWVALAVCGAMGLLVWGFDVGVSAFMSLFHIV